MNAAFIMNESIIYIIIGNGINKEGHIVMKPELWSRFPLQKADLISKFDFRHVAII